MNAPDAGRGTARGVRGVLAASAATLVALASHLAGGGDVPGWLGILVPWVLSLPVCTALVARRLTLPRLSVSVAASQLLFHLLFQLGTPVGTLQAVADPHGAHGGHGDMAPLATSGAPVQTALLHGGPSMWLWHGIAAAVTVVVLHRGELLLRRLRELGSRMAAWLLRAWVVLDRPISFVAPARSGVPAETFRPLHPGPQLSPLLRRGPPAPHAV
ncbi:hypothetical protein [Promicromonospora sp. MEB111]|uniref:hypothetical protein n=1 Tax=unclassified Promicromonospora TaxID=2647929 RepID=UPI00254B79DF|nr:hypothetical protein [Promicromonospora sp. MEB111]